MENRGARRWRARLRMVRLFDTSRRFLVECRVLDLSLTGARLKPEIDRPLPLTLNYSDGDDRNFASATLIWVRKGEIGIRFVD
ncbi:PilZ domain-containing protein [Bosea caraganae]|uniref:PilZ domain-containing protein n=1 Tax=Bosea caraganae TaxID=2763117 RepID=A0A370L0V5_9HYPH|nr:PilZ domain-containing protein [Bosea caraganae]RDJ21036.1 PilZ domain-containing protein [Bosea caraganae]RDJ28535.1 PilZ domain-containing protein [Bosea caraganae]